jgi:nicotinate phosphoribosyltransferase
MRKRIINSILDTDLYKITMMFAITMLYPMIRVRYKFKNRNGVPFPPNFAMELRNQIMLMRDIALTDDEARYLELRCPYFPHSFIEVLKKYRFDPTEVGVTQNGDVLEVTIDGYWCRTVLWEVPLMAIISELFFDMTGQETDKKQLDLAEQRTIEKAKLMKGHGMQVIEFGTRRRKSLEVQMRVNEVLMSYGKGMDAGYMGSSNVMLSMINDADPKGTQAHEWTMFHGMMFGPIMANKMAMDAWLDVFNGDLAIALPDTFTTEVFLRSFGKYYASLYDGVRQDSGNPSEIGNRIVSHYISVKINPKHKGLMFSDSLNMDKSLRLHNEFRNQINDSFGIGTDLTNDVDVKPLNMVIKLDGVYDDDELVSVIKLGDGDSMKHSGAEEYIRAYKTLLRIE